MYFWLNYAQIIAYKYLVRIVVGLFFRPKRNILIDDENDHVFEKIVIRLKIEK